MKSTRTLKTAFGALRRNVLRAVLTTLGIVIGVAAVITMMEIGKGASIAIQRTMASMGANTLVIFPAAASIAGVNLGAGTMMTMTPGDAEAIAKECPAVGHVAPIVRARTQVVYGNRNYVPTYIFGTAPPYLQVREWTDLDEGEAFTEQEVRNSSKVCLIGQTIVKELFGGQSPVGKEIRIRNVAFKVIGVLQKKAPMSWAWIRTIFFWRPGRPSNIGWWLPRWPGPIKATRPRPPAQSIRLIKFTPTSSKIFIQPHPTPKWPIFQQWSDSPPSTRF